MQEMEVWSLGEEDRLEEGMATHSSILVWRVPWTEEPGGLQSVGSQRVWPDWTAEHRHVWDLRSMTRGWTHSLCIGRRSLNHQAPWEGTSLFLIFSPLLLRFLLPVFMFLKHSFLRRGTQTTLQPPRRNRDCPPPNSTRGKNNFCVFYTQDFFLGAVEKQHY